MCMHKFGLNFSLFFQFLNIIKILFQMQVQDSERLVNKRDLFRVEIRKSQINQIFSIKRKEIEKQFLRYKLDKNTQKQIKEDAQERRAKIQQIARKLKKQPSESLIEALITYAKEYLENQQFWIKLNIINDIKVLYKKQNNHLNLKEKLSYLLTLIIQNNESSAKIIESFISTEFIDDLTQAYFQQIADLKSLYSINNLIYLLTHLIHQSYIIRQMLIERSFIQLLIKLGNQFTSYKDVTLLSMIIQSLLKVWQKQQQNLKYNKASAFLPLLCCYIAYDQSQILKATLKSIISLSKGLEYKISNLFYAENIKFKVIELITYKESTVTELCLQICNIFVSTNNKHFTTELAKYGLLDQVNSVLKNPPTKLCRKYSFAILIYFVLNSQFQIELLMNHEVFQIIIDYSETKQELYIKKMALSIFEYIVERSQMSTISKLIERQHLFHVWIENIKNFKDIQPEIPHICLKTLNNIIRAYQNVYIFDQENKIFSKLCREFEFEAILQDLCYNNKNKSVRMLAELIITQMICQKQ